MLSYKFLRPHCDSDAEALRHVRVRKVIHLKNDTSAASTLMRTGMLSFQLKGNTTSDIKISLYGTPFSGKPQPR